MEEKDLKSNDVYNLDNPLSLSKYMDVALLSPFGTKNSVARLDMVNSAIRHTVIPNEPERPLVDSIFTKDIIRSSSNYKTEGCVELIKKIPKIINGVVTENTYIYRNLDDNKVYVEVVPAYIPSYRFGSKGKSELEELEEGTISTRPVYTKYIHAMDPEDGGMAFGKNINFIYSIERRVGEDAITISKELSESLAVNLIDEVSFTLSQDQILKDIYGYEDAEGNHHYKPFKLPGEEVKDGVVAVLSTSGKDFLSTTSSIQDSDKTLYVHGGRVYDVTVFCNERISNTFLDVLREENLSYVRSIAHTLNSINSSMYTNETKILTEKYNAILGSTFRMGTTELKSRVWVEIKIVNTRPVQVGDKLTNRHGGKGTVSCILDEPYYASDGTPIHMIINATGVINRENPAQLFEKGLNEINVFLRKYLNSTLDNIDIKYKNILEWINLSKAKDLYKTALTIDKNDLVTYVTENDLTLKYDPGRNDFIYDDYLKLVEFTNSLYPIEPFTITYKGKALQSKHMYGKAFYLVLENGPLKDTSTRTDGILSYKGTLSKKGEDNKNHQTKFGTTAVKASDIGVNILVNRLKVEDVNLLRNNTSTLKSYLKAAGLKLEFTEKTNKGEGDND